MINRWLPPVIKSNNVEEYIVACSNISIIQSKRSKVLFSNKQEHYYVKRTEY